MAAVADPTWFLLPELCDSRAVRAWPWPRAWGDKVVEVEVDVVAGTVVAGVPMFEAVVGELAEGDEEVASTAMTTATTATVMATMAMSRPRPRPRDAPASSEGGGGGRGGDSGGSIADGPRGGGGLGQGWRPPGRGWRDDRHRGQGRVSRRQTHGPPASAAEPCVGHVVVADRAWVDQLGTAGGAELGCEIGCGKGMALGTEHRGPRMDGGGTGGQVSGVASRRGKGPW